MRRSKRSPVWAWNWSERKMGQAFQPVVLRLKIISELIIRLPISFAQTRRIDGILPSAAVHVTQGRPRIMACAAGD